MKGRWASWLDLAVVAAQGDPARIAVHAVGDCGATCVVLLIDGRPLHDGEGRMTVFHSPEVIRHVLACCGFTAPMPELDVSDGGGHAIACGDDPHCIDLNRRGRLVKCKHSCRVKAVR